MVLFRLVWNLLHLCWRFNTSNFLDRGQKMGHSAPREFFSPSSLWRISLIVRPLVRKCCPRTLAPTKGYFWRNAASCGPKGQRPRPGRGASLQNKSPFLNLWSKILMWDRPYASAPSGIASSWWVRLSRSSLSRNIWWGIFVPVSPSIVDTVLYKLDKFITVYLIWELYFKKFMIGVSLT
jgi:hypothetical protein